jgi:tryptophan synthase alpha chain
MRRIPRAFASSKASSRAAFVAFLTAGDPSLERTEEAAIELDRAGVSVLELGVPFSDPVADGPVIQRSSERALRRGTTLKEVLSLVRRIRKRTEMPLLLFTYFNPFLRMGLDRASGEARDAGVDGVLVTDLPPEEADPWLEAARGSDLDTVFLASPTSSDDRLRRLAAVSSGFVYAVSRTGVTGERGSLSSDAGPLVRRLRDVTAGPLALGFGISTPEQVRETAAMVDGVVVGSALVRFLEENPGGDLTEHARWLMSGL